MGWAAARVTWSGRGAEGAAAATRDGTGSRARSCIQLCACRRAGVQGVCCPTGSAPCRAAGGCPSTAAPAHHQSSRCRRELRAGRQRRQGKEAVRVQSTRDSEGRGKLPAQRHSTAAAGGSPDASASAAMVSAVMVFTFWFSSCRPAGREGRTGQGGQAGGSARLSARLLGAQLEKGSVPSSHHALHTRSRGTVAVSQGPSVPHTTVQSRKGRTVLDDVHQGLEVRQHGAAHEDGNLLHNLDARVPRLPALLGLAHRLEEGQQRGDAQGRRHHCTYMATTEGGVASARPSPAQQQRPGHVPPWRGSLLQPPAVRSAGA